MTLRIARRWFTGRSTTGQLYIDNVYQCDTLEDRVRRDPDPATPANEAKVPGETAIPALRYPLELVAPKRTIWSPRSDGRLLHVMGVPGFTGIFVHAFNKPEESLGCIGVGRRDPAVPNWIGASRDALKTLMALVDARVDAGGVWLEIEEFGRPPDEELV